MTKQVTPPPPGDRPGPSAPPPPPRWRHWLWPAALMIALLLWLVLPALHASKVEDLTYSQFLSRVSSHQVKTVTLESSGSATGTLSDGKAYSTVIPSQAGEQFLNQLQTQGVEITATSTGPSFGSQVISWLILLVPFLLIGWLWVRLSRGDVGEPGLRPFGVKDLGRGPADPQHALQLPAGAAGQPHPQPADQHDRDEQDQP